MSIKGYRFEKLAQTPKANQKEMVDNYTQGALNIPTRAIIESQNDHSSQYGIDRTKDICHAGTEHTSLTVPKALEPETTQPLKRTYYLRGIVKMRHNQCKNVCAQHTRTPVERKYDFPVRYEYQPSSPIDCPVLDGKGQRAPNQPLTSQR